jgi:hypothetical protein
MTPYFTITRGVRALAWGRGDTHVNASGTTIHTLLRAVTILWGRLVGVPSGSGRLGAPLGPAFWRHLQMPAPFAACRYVGQPILSAAGFQPAPGVSTFSCDFPRIHALYVGQALSPANSLCSTAESFPTGIPISRREPSCLSPGVWLAPSHRPGCRGRPGGANIRRPSVRHLRP